MSLAFSSSEYPPRLQLAQRPTPLQPLDRLSARLGGPRIWVKRDDLTGCGESGNKVRKLEFSLAAALAEGADTVITCGGVQSNHCRTTALLCARLGLRCRLLLRGEPPADLDGNLLLDQLAGASIQYYPARRFQHELPMLLQQEADRERAAGHHPFIIPTGASDGIGIWGYIAACEELAVDFQAEGIQPGHLICATGSGGTQAGLSVGSVLFGLGLRVWGMAVCDEAAWFHHKVQQDIEDWRERYGIQLDGRCVPVQVIDEYVGPGYGRAEAVVFETIVELARTEGLLLDPVYTGKAFHGLLSEYRAGRFDDSDDIVFVHTGGLFGLFPQRQGLGLNAVGQP